MARPWSDPLRWTSDVLLHRVADTAANLAKASGRHSEGEFISLFNIPHCSPPWAVEMAGSKYSAPAKIIRSAVDTNSPSRLRTLEQSDTRLIVEQIQRRGRWGFSVVYGFTFGRWSRTRSWFGKEHLQYLCLNVRCNESSSKQGRARPQAVSLIMRQLGIGPNRLSLTRSRGRSKVRVSL